MLALSASILTGQSNYELFKKLFAKRDTSAVSLLLKNWENTSPTDPELYTSAFNYYYSTAEQEIISLQKEEPKNESIRLNDSTGKVAGYLTAESAYNPGKIDRALQYINKGIRLFPDRLDMRFGKCYALGQIRNYGDFTNTLVETIEYSVINKNNWLWTENKKQENAQLFMLETIQTYLSQLYDAEDDNLLPYMIQIGEATLKHYPKSIEILSTTAVAFMLTKKYDKAIELLKKAENLNPEDFIVLNNIAHAYKLKGDKTNAIKYYELTEKYGDEQAKEQARESIRKLNQQ